MAGGVSGWVLGLGALLLLSGYVFGLRALKRQAANSTPEPVATGPFRDVELERYMRHFILREIGGPGQKKLKDAKVLVIGAGGLGAPLLQYLAAAGVGTIGVMDDDVVDASNLQRQVIHTDAQLGVEKVFSAKEAMVAQNPFVEVLPYVRRFDVQSESLLEAYDLVVDGSDNFETRYRVNRASVASNTPLLAAAITQWEGQISTYNTGPDAPCYQCVFPQEPAEGMVPTCAEAGVAAPLPGILGTMLAMEVIKEITGAGEGLTGRLMMYDALYAEPRVIRVKKRDDCPVCGSKSA